MRKGMLYTRHQTSGLVGVLVDWLRSLSLYELWSSEPRAPPCHLLTYLLSCVSELSILHVSVSHELWATIVSPQTHSVLLRSSHQVPSTEQARWELIAAVRHRTSVNSSYCCTAEDRVGQVQVDSVRAGDQTIQSRWSGISCGRGAIMEHSPGLPANSFILPNFSPRTQDLPV